MLAEAAITEINPMWSVREYQRRASKIGGERDLVACRVMSVELFWRSVAYTAGVRTRPSNRAGLGIDPTRANVD